MNMFDEARSYECMLKMRKITQGQLAALLGITQSAVANKLRLLRLDGRVQEKIVDSGLTERHARELLRLESADEQLRIIERVRNERLSVARCASLVDMASSREAPSKIGNAERLKATDLFLDSVKKSVKALSSLGIDARVTESILDKKIYVTICIAESK
ncbi:MAG: hypothetical protein J6K85_01065 [Clostridia bacterium]|nr:hypothetical protein [Clostridia bacterium]